MVAAWTIHTDASSKGKASQVLGSPPMAGAQAAQAETLKF